ncbi:hypothetical protein [Rhizobium herbae]
MKVLSLALQSGVSRHRYRAMIPVGHRHRFMAYLRILGPQVAIFAGRQEAARPIRVHALVVGPKLRENCIKPRSGDMSGSIGRNHEDRGWRVIRSDIVITAHERTLGLTAVMLAVAVVIVTAAVRSGESNTYGS